VREKYADILIVRCFWRAVACLKRTLAKRDRAESGKLAPALDTETERRLKGERTK